MLLPHSWKNPIEFMGGISEKKKKYVIPRPESNTCHSVKKSKSMNLSLSSTSCTIDLEQLGKCPTLLFPHL